VPKSPCIDRGSETEAAALTHPAINPQAVNARIAFGHPGVVVVREQVNLRIRIGCPQMREHRRSEQQVANLVALDDENLHGSPDASDMYLRAPFSVFAARFHFALPKGVPEGTPGLAGVAAKQSPAPGEGARGADIRVG
jgi:hypothetical protein